MTANRARCMDQFQRAPFRSIRWAQRRHSRRGLQSRRSHLREPQLGQAGLRWNHPPTAPTDETSVIENSSMRMEPRTGVTCVPRLRWRIDRWRATLEPPLPATLVGRGCGFGKRLP
jgi:hypothetical protein